MVIAAECCYYFFWSRYSMSSTCCWKLIWRTVFCFTISFLISPIAPVFVVVTEKETKHARKWNPWPSAPVTVFLGTFLVTGMVWPKLPPSTKLPRKGFSVYVRQTFMESSCFQFCLNCPTFLCTFISIIWCYMPAGCFFRNCRQNKTDVPNAKILRDQLP